MDTMHFMRCGCLAVSLASGALYREPRNGGPPEFLGHVEDADVEWHEADDHTVLLDRWRDARSHEAEATFSYYDRLKTPLVN